MRAQTHTYTPTHMHIASKRGHLVEKVFRVDCIKCQTGHQIVQVG